MSASGLGNFPSRSPSVKCVKYVPELGAGSSPRAAQMVKAHVAVTGETCIASRGRLQEQQSPFIKGKQGSRGYILFTRAKGGAVLGLAKANAIAMEWASSKRVSLHPPLICSPTTAPGLLPQRHCRRNCCRSSVTHGPRRIQTSLSDQPSTRWGLKLAAISKLPSSFVGRRAWSASWMTESRAGSARRKGRSLPDLALEVSPSVGQRELQLDLSPLHSPSLKK